MEREAFRQRMQQYKQARENNPQLKYWDWKKYADGGTIDEDPPQSTSERPIIFNLLLLDSIQNGSTRYLYLVLILQ